MKIADAARNNVNNNIRRFYYFLLDGCKLVLNLKNTYAHEYQQVRSFRRNTCVKLSEELSSSKKALKNIDNNAGKCFGWCLV